nr:PREDICTED: uncharacterized protein LOC109038194 [Bemisia tabaci]
MGDLWPEDQELTAEDLEQIFADEQRWIVQWPANESLSSSQVERLLDSTEDLPQGTVEWPANETLSCSQVERMFASLEDLAQVSNENVIPGPSTRANADPDIVVQSGSGRTRQQARLSPSQPRSQSRSTPRSTPRSRRRSPPASPPRSPSPLAPRSPPPSTPRSRQRASSSSRSRNVNFNDENHLNFEILSDETRQFDSILTVQQTVSLVLKDIPADGNQMEWFHETFEQLIEYLMRHSNAGPDDRVQLDITSVSKPEMPLFISPRLGHQLSVDVIASRLEKILNSNDEFLLAGPLRVKFNVLKIPTGNGYRMSKNVSKTMTAEQWFSRKRSIIPIYNRDNLCLARALVLAVAHCQRNDSPEMMKHFNNIRRSELRSKKNSNLQKSEAQLLCRRAKVNLENGGSIDDVLSFQTFLVDYTITVWSERTGRETLFEGPRSTPLYPRRNVDLYFEDNHYVVLTSLSGAFGSNFFCRECKVGYHKVEAHKCATQCPACNSKTQCNQSVARVTCSKCNRYFYGKLCYENHFQKYNKKKTICEAVNQCTSCFKVFNTTRRKKPHFCGEIFCSICGQHVSVGHLCYMQPIRERVYKKSERKNADPDPDQDQGSPSSELLGLEGKKKIKDNFLYVFYDLEATQCKKTNADEYLHEPNFCVARQHCKQCLDNFEIDEDCENCGKRENIFRGYDCIHNFLEYLRSLPFDKITILAHNGKGYDFQFCIREMVVVQGWKNVEIINSGSKILTIKYGNLRWIDSLSFLSAPLSQLPKMMSIDNIAKGHFPYLFNRPENDNYEGPIPPLSEFCPDDMSSKAREELIQWHEEKVRENYVFNLKHELEFYCRLDVEILSKACLKFRQLFLDETGLDPYTGITVPQMCMKTFQKNFLKENTIGIVPIHGYRMVDNQSLAALQWLDWVAKDKNINIKHAGNTREMVPPGLKVKVDGYSPEHSLIFEFYGCYWHGCPKCFHSGRNLALPSAKDETMELRYEKTMTRERSILNYRDNNGSPIYKLETTWECEFNVLKSTCAEVKRFCVENKAQYLVQPLRAKDSYYGGRTNSFHLHCKVDASKGEKIHYIDYCSLYPYVLARGIFPVGQVKQVLHGEQIKSLDISSYTGLIKCIILAPDFMIHPVLPVRCHGKLFFPLCRTCAELSLQEDCTHQAEERWLEGTWVTLEVQKAISLGYKMIKIHEIWDFETTQFDGKSGGLFVDYVKKFLKMKQQASGWPSWVKTDADRAKYLSEYKRVENIDLDPNKIESNPSLRAVSKILLNSFYGKLGQRDSFIETRILTEKSEIVKVFTNPSIDVQSFQPIADDFMIVNTKAVEESVRPSKKTNVILAAFCTAQARLKLYELLEQVQGLGVYVDTDSLFYLCPRDREPIKTGDYLGELTDEIIGYGEGSYISEFIGAGPKSYAYKVCIGGDPSNTVTVCKIRGFTLNHRASKIVNFESIRRAVLEEGDTLTVNIPNKIARKPGWNVVTKSENKIYRVVYTKRRRLPDSYETLPFGAKKAKFQ